MISEAADFFASTVKPTVDEFFYDPRDVRRGRLAALVLYHMAEHLALDGHTGRDKKEMDRKGDAIREKLKAQCPDFSLIGDIADATKHAKLFVRTKAPREVSSSQQITASPGPGLFQAPFGEGLFAEALFVFAILDDGTAKPLEPAIRSVMAALEELLAGSQS
ncbi:MAG: hypothetical protein WAV95_00310 [Azonexus sp.]